MIVIARNGHYHADVKVPIKVWLKDYDNLEKGCEEQAINLANLPFAYHHIALMPDTHEGFGMPIGGVLAADGVIVPNAVGVDIGCGMAFLETNIPADIVRQTQTGSGTLAQLITGSIMRNVPVGFDRHKSPQTSKALDFFKWRHHGDLPEELEQELDNGYYQVGTLGGGNHFIELQSNVKGNLCIMVHSGSRNFGYKVADYYNAKAEELNELWGVPNVKAWQLAFLPVEHALGQEYLEWHDLAADFAAENRDAILDSVAQVVFRAVDKHTGITASVEQRLNCHHNYVAQEEHFGKAVWVHRKGAIRAGKGEKGIIPGAMGVHSYLVRGMGNEDAFLSCSHGAGRKMGRKAAKGAFRVDEVMSFFKAKNIVFGKKDKSDAADEYHGAYKDLDEVMANQTDLVEIGDRLENAGVVIKG